MKSLRAAHESWNKRDLVGVVSNAVKGLAYTDHGRNITLNTRDKFREWTEEWAKAFSDGALPIPSTLVRSVKILILQSWSITKSEY